MSGTPKGYWHWHRPAWRRRRSNRPDPGIRLSSGQENRVDHSGSYVTWRRDERSARAIPKFRLTGYALRDFRMLHPLGSVSWFYRVGLLWLVVPLACGRTEVQPTSEATLTDSLVGTWRVVAHLPRRPKEGEQPRPAASELRGYLAYDPTGHVQWQLLRRGAADSLSARRWREVPDSLLRRLLTGFESYFGTFTVDEGARTVTHRIEGEFLPRSGQVEVASPFRLSGDTLVLGADSLEQWLFVRVR